MLFLASSPIRPVGLLPSRCHRSCLCGLVRDLHTNLLLRPRTKRILGFKERIPVTKTEIRVREEHPYIKTLLERNPTKPESCGPSPGPFILWKNTKVTTKSSDACTNGLLMLMTRPSGPLSTILYRLSLCLPCQRPLSKTRVKGMLAWPFWKTGIKRAASTMAPRFIIHLDDCRDAGQ